MKRITLTLTTGGVAWSVEGWATDDVPGLAVHHGLNEWGQRSKLWTVTHIASGLAVAVNLPQRRIAVAVCRTLRDATNWMADGQTVAAAMTGRRGMIEDAVTAACERYGWYEQRRTILGYRDCRPPMHKRIEEGAMTT